MTNETKYNFINGKAKAEWKQLTAIRNKFGYKIDKETNKRVQDWRKGKRIIGVLYSMIKDEQYPKKAQSYGFKDGYTMDEAHKQINAEKLDKKVEKAIKDWQVANAVEA